MAEGTSAWLKRWVDDTIGDQVAILGPPQAGAQPGGRGVALHLIDVTPVAGGRDVTSQPFEAGLWFLVTAWAPHPTVTQRLLNRLLVAAVRSPGIEVRLDPPPIDAWRGLGMAPQPGFLVCCRTGADAPSTRVSPVNRRVVEIYLDVARQMSAASGAPRQGSPARAGGRG